MDEQDRIIGEIQKLRDDMRDDVNGIHDKIERFHDKTDKKIEHHRQCIIEKIEEQRKQRQTCFENCSEAMSKKVGNRWFMWIVGFIIIGIIAIGGYSAANRADIKELNTTMKDHIKQNTEQMDDLKKMIMGDIE